MSHKEKEMNFDLDLLPVISMMSVCICFLLLTAVWSQVGSLDIKQGLGQESNRSSAPESASLWVSMREGGDVSVKMMDSVRTPEAMKAKSFRLDASGRGMSDIETYVSQLKQYDPDFKTALILSDARVNYGSVIKMMDHLKRLQVNEIGIAPL